ncbi:MAG: helix-turn-helix domain-containing protein [Candidatus Heimdallarchaeota archaeon]|nr:helix-turn-helix domain-containing protein [Candidatus Heimdallarchaeota archaeon]
MLRSKIAISTKHYYSCELSKKLPVRTTVLAVNGPEGLGFTEALDKQQETLEEYVKLLKKSDQIIDVQVTHKTPTMYWNKVKHTLDYPSIHDSILESGSMTIMPIIIENGVQYHNILSPTADSFRKLLKFLQERFTDINIRALSSKPVETLQDFLTEKQYETLILAHRKGYYEIPRKCTLEEIGKELGIKRIACQERIRRTEKRIIDYYVKDSLFSEYGFY